LKKENGIPILKEGLSKVTPEADPRKEPKGGEPGGLTESSFSKVLVEKRQKAWWPEGNFPQDEDTILL